MTEPESRNRRSGIGPLVYYVLLQVPGYLFLGALLYILMSRDWLGVEGVVWIMGLWLAKDVALYPLYRPALMANQQADAIASLEGSTGYARTEIADRGLVLVRGEFWRARTTANPIPVGTRIRVHGSEGRVLIVEALQESTQTAAE